MEEVEEEDGSSHPDAALLRVSSSTVPSARDFSDSCSSLLLFPVLCCHLVTRLLRHSDVTAVDLTGWAEPGTEDGRKGQGAGLGSEKGRPPEAP